MCVSDKGSGRSDEGGRKLFVAPAIEIPLLCLVRPECARTHTHNSKSESVSCYRKRVADFRPGVGMHLSAAADMQTHMQTFNIQKKGKYKLPKLIKRVT